MSTIDFSNFIKKPSSMTDEEGGNIKKFLVENLKKRLLNAIPEASREVVAGKLETIKIDIDAVKEQSLSSVINYTIQGHFENDSTIKSVLTDVVARLKGNEQTIAEIVGLDLPLRDNPAFKKEFYKAKTKALGEIIQLPAVVIEQLSEGDGDIDDLSDDHIKKLSDNQQITPVQASELKLVINLSRLTGSNIDLIKAVQISDVSIYHFIAFDAADWKNILTTHNIPIPEDEKSADSYAKRLARTVEISFRDRYFLTRINKKDFTNQLKTFSAFEKVSNLGRIGFQGSKIILDEINWTGLTDAEKISLQKDIEDLQAFAHTYKYLNITEIIAQQDIDTGAKTAIVQNRLDQLDLFYKNNEQADLMQVDFFNPAIKLDYTGINEENKVLVKKQAMALQRMLPLGITAQTTQQLLASGFSSAFEIIDGGQKELVAATGLPVNEADHIYKSALNSATATSHFVQAIRDAQRGGFTSLAVNNLGQLVNDLREINGYSDLFGSQNFCECDHCKSIFSPGAYFADLMLFIKKNVTDTYFTGLQANNPLNLQSRRPDLWKVELSCENTSTEIPYLDVVVDVLERYIKSGFSDINKDIYEELAVFELSNGLPFNLPLEELRSYLGHFGLSLSRIFQLLNEGKYRQAQEKLLLSDKDILMIGIPNPAKALLLYGNPASLIQFSVSDFIRFAGISRQDLDEMTEVEFIPELKVMGIYTIESSNDIQQYKEVFITDSITLASLDFADRFVRLWKRTPWSILEFDQVLGALKKGSLFSNLEELDDHGHFKFLILADIVFIQNSLKLTVEELCAIIDDLPETSLKPNQKALYQRIFNLAEIFVPEATLEKIKPYLLAGLSVTEQDLNSLLAMLGIASSVAPDKGILSKLYRQSRLATGLSLSIEAFIAASHVFFAGGQISSVDQVIRLIDSKLWLESTPFTFQNLDFILNGTESTANKFVFNAEKVKALAAELTKVNLSDTFLIEQFHSRLQAIFKISPAQFVACQSLLTDEPQIIISLRSNPETADYQPVLSFLSELQRKMLCFEKLKWTDADVLFFKNNPDAFGLTDLKNWSFDHVKAMVSYNILVRDISDESKAELNLVLQSTRTVIDLNNATAIDLFASLWSYSSTILHSVIGTMTLNGSPLDGLAQLYELSAICNTLGIQADSLRQLREPKFSGLVAAKNVVYAAFVSKYADEKTRLEKLAPYHDKLNTLKRNALCDYILAQPGTFNFKDRSDLYYFFLLDVEMSGCFRTSKLLAAISSAQLYIHRCLLNLERSATDNRFGVLPESIPLVEWEWLKNYRVWEANRKVFLYPENYIEPELRDTKTPLFKELEDELLQQDISVNTAEIAYKKYLAQFLELSNIRYAGAYYNYVANNPVRELAVARLISGFDIVYPSTIVDEEKTIYYLFARTHLQPYQYYYRTYNQYSNLWGHWIKIDLPIEAEEISAIIHNGKLHIYWTEVRHKEVTKIIDGDAKSESVIFKIFVKYSVFDVNGRWSVPQQLFMGKIGIQDDRLFRRINVDNSEAKKKENQDNKDSLIEKYKGEVFKKPYTIKTPISEKLLIKHIYTPNLNIVEIEYEIERFTFKHEYHDGSFFRKYEISLGPFSFIVTNDEFDQVPIINPDESKSIKLISATLAVLTISFGPIKDLKVYLRVKTLTLFPELVYKNNYTQHVYKHNDNPDSLFQGHPLVLTDPLYKEFNLAFNERSIYSFYVEDGTEEFTDSNKIIEQYATGKAHLHTGNNSSDLKVLSTILSEELNIKLWENGLENFLSLQTQTMSNSAGEHFDFNGPYGAYYWEMFFHIPFLIANNLNANQDFKGAKWWYERIFDPTSTETPNAEKPAEHCWQFYKFRNLRITKLKDILSDESTIAVYRQDPFDPHAIAQLRLTAYQKAVVMKYIDNLLDWGDFLFTQDTQESIVEANMLYQLAQDILGKRPERAGRCKTGNDEELTFEKIIAARVNDSEFLINLENVRHTVQFINKNDKEVLEKSKYLSKLLEERGNQDATPSEFSKWAVLTNAVYHADLITVSDTITPGQILAANADQLRIAKYSEVKALDYIPLPTKSKIQLDLYAFNTNLILSAVTSKPPATSITGNMAFCVPVNENLMGYWDRVADRLFKIRNCMNISGIRRSLSLYQPPIDPMLLIRAKAAGLSLEEILDGGLDTVSLPNYRFVYMLEKAKQFIQTVQSFGSALLSALEKKDGEELTLLRSVHERNILRLTKDIKNKQVQEAQKQFLSLEENIANIQNRIEYFGNLVDEGLIAAERTQTISKHIAFLARGTEATFGSLAAIHYLIPQVGSPFSLNYGGQQNGNHFDAFSRVMTSIATVADTVAESAGMIGGFQRRNDEWKFQLQTAKQELKQTTQQLLAADLRIKITERDQQIHEKTIEQLTEAHEFFQGKFTNFGLYSFMATSLNRLYRMSYGIALELAKQAEHCYKNETYDDTTFIGNDNWQNERAGLLAGEQLMLQLNQMEQHYMDGYKRSPEITQNFSLALLNPEALLKLKQTGTCRFKIPEIAFDMLYPGQFRRLIRGVRISIPCIAGPYTNIGANLRLTKSEVRKNQEETILYENTPEEKPSISTSSAMNDSGTFEFSFRDERYLPFEYAGAISEWELSLPSTIRSFNYNSISDVIMHLSYIAKEGDRAAGEKKLIGAISEYLEANGLFKLVSLKYEFPDAFHLLQNKVEQSIKFDLAKDHFPYFLFDKVLSMDEVVIYLKPKKNTIVSIPPILKIDDVPTVLWEASKDIAGSDPSLETDKIKGGMVNLIGTPQKEWKIEVGSSGIDKETVEDILILIKYHLL